MMIESSHSSNELPYRARIMMNALTESGKRLGLRNSALYSSSSMSIYADLQPLQWLQQDAILSITPLDHEEEFVPGREDIVSVNTSPIKVEVVSDCAFVENDGGERSTTIADFYRYQAMRAALASVGGQNGVRGAQGQLCVGSLARPSLQHSVSLNEYQKPPFSYTHIIFMAIETSPNKAMTVNDIYVWCETHFPYYTQAGVGWKNSLRHNLSINKSFKKISRDGRGGPGRGAYWVVEPRERNNLIDAIRRSPCSLGHFPFLSNMHPWGSSNNCYSNNLFHSSASFKNNLTSISSSTTTTTTTRSLITNKLKSTLIDPSLVHTGGPLLRIGGQITDASHLIRTHDPVIQRLHDPNTNIIDLSLQTPQIISTNTITLSTIPLIQMDQGSLESVNEQVGEEESVEMDDNDESQCHGIVVVTEDTETEYNQSYLEITRNLVERDVDKSDSGRTESINMCPEHSTMVPATTTTTTTTTTSHGPTKNTRLDSGVIEDILPPEDVAPLSREIIKKHCSTKQRKKCTCNKDNGSESEDSMTSISIADYSEQSDTDFNWRRSLGRRKRLFKQKKSSFFKKLKSFNNHRKLNTRNRVTNIIRAPHSDHVYALLQEFLPTANIEEMSSTVEHIDQNESHSLAVNAQSFSPDLSITTLSKRSKHKLQSRRRSSSQLCYSDSDKEGDSTANGMNNIKKLRRFGLSLKPVKQKQSKLMLTKKLLRQYSNENEDMNEEQENRYYDENCSQGRAYSVSEEDWTKHEELESQWQGSNASNELIESTACVSIPPAVRRGEFNKDPSSNKRKVGRPKKSDQDSIICRRSSEHQIHRDKISGFKLKKKVKLLKNEIKYLKESNSNKTDSTICKHKEQAAIDVLVDLQRKNKQERIDNMYNISHFIDRSTSDSNLI